MPLERTVNRCQRILLVFQIGIARRFDAVPRVDGQFAVIVVHGGPVDAKRSTAVGDEFGARQLEA